MKLERDDAKLGLLVFLSLALFVGFLFQRSLTAILKQEFRVQVHLENAAEVAEGTEVQLQGLRVGTVKAVVLQRNGVQYRFRVALGLRTDILLWEGTRVLVVAKPLGGSFLDLQLPPPAARRTALAPDSLLEGQSGPTLSTLVDDLHTLMRNLNQGVDEFRGHLQQKGLGAVLDHPQVNQVFGQLKGTLQAFEQVAKDGKGLVAHSETTMTALDRSLVSLERSLNGLQKLMDSRQGDLDAIVRHLAGTLKELEGLSKDLNVLVRAAGPNGDESVKALERNLRSTEELLELLKAKPNRLVWGKPSQADRDAAARKVEEARKAQRDKDKDKDKDKEKGKP